MTEIIGQIRINWVAKQTDCRLCSKCKSVIVSEMYVCDMSFEWGEKIHTNLVLCKQCNFDRQLAVSDQLN